MKNDGGPESCVSLLQMVIDAFWESFCGAKQPLPNSYPFFSIHFADRMSYYIIPPRVLSNPGGGRRAFRFAYKKPCIFAAVMV